MSSEKTKDIDYIFTHIVGGSGRWQWKTTLMLFPFVWVGGYPLFLAVFATYTPLHRCLVPGCDLVAQGNQALDFKASWLEFAIPSGKINIKL